MHPPASPEELRRAHAEIPLPRPAFYEACTTPWLRALLDVRVAMHRRAAARPPCASFKLRAAGPDSPDPAE